MTTFLEEKSQESSTTPPPCLPSRNSPGYWEGVPPARTSESEKEAHQYGGKPKE